MKLLIAGATGLVGGHTLTLATQDPRFDTIIAPTRRALPSSQPKLDNPTIDFANLPADLFAGVDAVACAIGTTLKKAGSKERFREIDKDLVVSLATAAHRAGVRRFAYVSSVGANAKSGTFYLRMKGETEAALSAIGFESLTILRPSFLGGDRDESRPMERFGLGLARAMSFAIPKRYRIVPAEAVARTMLDTLAAGQAGQHVIESEAIVGANT
ncbi:MAG TPA: NAD(P)H-binding protein [Myxococcota bacterium]|nr:NAD(P)H-binding protein [Myxococcota bacterium]